MVWISVPSISGWASHLPCFCVRQSPSAAAPALMDGSAWCRHRDGPGAQIYCFWEGRSVSRGTGWAPSRAGLPLPTAAPLAALIRPNSSSWQLRAGSSSCRGFYCNVGALLGLEFELGSCCCLLGFCSMGWLRGAANKLCRAVESKAGEHLQLLHMGET
uniref:Uncharacterized protein n=1 Tax=Junco hyemalis TaxID=40217 RepID=A0A8C5IIA4_JUNHY